MGSATRIASHKACTWTPLWGKVSFTVGVLYPCRTQKTPKNHKKDPHRSSADPGRATFLIKDWIGTPHLSVAKTHAIACKSLRFQIANCKVARFAAEFAEKSPEHRSDSFGRGMKITAFPCFQNQSQRFSGRQRRLTPPHEHREKN